MESDIQDIAEGRMKVTSEMVYNQNGGVVEINYGDFKVLAPVLHLQQGIELLKNTADKTSVMINVQKAIDESLPSVTANTAPLDQAMRLCQDITIWYANEIIEGRAENFGLLQ